MNPIVKSSYAAIAPEYQGVGELDTRRADILWHTKELKRLVGDLEFTPSLAIRVKSPFKEINRLLGTACLYHARYLINLLALPD
jgi:hypothetical protein